MKKILVSFLALQSASACSPECEALGQLPSVNVSVDEDISTDGIVGGLTETSFTLTTSQGEIVVNLPIAANDAIVAGAEVALVKRGGSFTVSDEAGVVLEILSTGIGPGSGDEGSSAAPAGDHAVVADSPARDRCADEGGEQESIPVQFAGQDFYTGTDEVVAVDGVNYRVRVLKSVLEESQVGDDTVVDRQVSAFVVKQK